MVAQPAAIPETTMEIWITKDHAGSRLWLKEPDWDNDTRLYIGREAICIPDSFTATWDNGDSRPLSISPPSDTI